MKSRSTKALNEESMLLITYSPVVISSVKPDVHPYERSIETGHLVQN